MLPWLLLVAVPDLVIDTLDRMPVARRGGVDNLVVGLLATSAAAAGAAYALEHTAAALLILVPAYHAGTRFGRFGFLLTSATGGIAYLLTVAVSDAEEGIAPTMLLWLAAASMLGLLGAWNQRLAADQASEESDPAAREAIELIARLQDLSGQMSTGLDALASATLALDLLAADVPSTRSAVLVTAGLAPPRARGAARVDARAVGRLGRDQPGCCRSARRGSPRRR